MVVRQDDGSVSILNSTGMRKLTLSFAPGEVTGATLWRSDLVVVSGPAPPLCRRNRNASTHAALAFGCRWRLLRGSGLFYAFTMTGQWQGRIRLVPYAKLPLQ